MPAFSFRSAARLGLLLTLALPAAPVAAQAPWTNVLIGADAANEPSIAINPRNTNQLAAGANIDNYYLSADAGRTWRAGTLNSPYGVWGDPALVADTTGTFYFFHLSWPDRPTNNLATWIDRIVCQRLDQFGAAQWSPGTFTGLRPPRQQDKHWPAVDPVTNALYVTWTEFDRYGSLAPTDSSRILFARSLDRGQTWSTPVTLTRRGGDAVDGSTTVEGAVPAVGPHGELYVTWAGPQGLSFNRSFDGGRTWLPHEQVIGPLPGGWAFDLPGLDRANGLPITVCDQSRGPNRGTIYVNWCDQRNGPTDTDVWLMASTDSGRTWSAPRRVNDDPPGRHQFFTWLTIDQTTGTLYDVFYDRRHHRGDTTDVFVAASTDGGRTFRNARVSTTSFVPDLSAFFGDYNNITAHAGVVRPIWTRMDQGQTSIWTALLDARVLSTTPPLPAPRPLLAWPNPAAEAAWVQAPGAGHLTVFDHVGRNVRRLETLGPLPAQLPLDGLAPGPYVLHWQGQTATAHIRLVVAPH